MVEEKQIDIYVLKSPKSGMVRYVGQTGRGKKRMYEHNSKSSKLQYPVVRWVSKLRRESLKPLYEVIDTLPKSLADEAEKKYILLFKSFGANLYNLSLGGAGNLISKNHNSVALKGRHLEDYYSPDKVAQIKSKISVAVSGINNPNFGRVFSKEFCENQKIIQSKTPIILIDKQGSVVGEFLNSKDAAKFIGCGASLVREMKNTKWYVRRKYLVRDKP